jgi:SAM-dependent methyltransferase/uncharacterized protein YbaR (Trm112 family)
VLRSHFQLFAPRCPACQRDGHDAPLTLWRIARELGPPADVVEGLLRCPRCDQAYPILEGIPILVPEPAAFVRDNIATILARNDLSDDLENALGDACGPGSWFDATRQHLSSYAWDHYAEFPPSDLIPSQPSIAPASARPGGAARLLATGLQYAAPFPASAGVLDVGCSVGRATFELAAHAQRPALGLDLNFTHLRLARDVARTGIARFPLKRAGLVYDQRAHAVNHPAAALADFWLADASALPLASGSAAAVSALNLLDCTSAPLLVLNEFARVLAPAGQAVVATPYDWSAAVGPPATWLGGHSKLGPAHGDPAAVLRALLTPGAHPVSLSGVRLRAEAPGLAWHVRMHDRSVIEYFSHLVVFERLG